VNDVAKAQAAARKGSRGTAKAVPKGPADDALKRDIIAVGLATLGALLLVSLLYKGDGIGVLPAKISLGLRLAVGLGSYVVPLAVFLLAVFYGFEHRALSGGRFAVGMALDLLALLVLLQLRNTPEWRTVFDDQQLILSGGGYAGAGLSYGLLRLLGRPGAYITIVGMAAVGIVMVTRSTARELLEGFGNTLLNGGGYVGDQVKEGAKRVKSMRPAPPEKPATRCGAIWPRPITRSGPTTARFTRKCVPRAVVPRSMSESTSL